MTSPSIEPIAANAYMHQTRGGSWPVKNEYLVMLLRKKGMNTDEIWQSIILNKGSVQHLTCLTDHEKAVFKTAIEIDQSWVIQHAADRQPLICQGQSLNLFFPPRAERSYINKVHLEAWKKGLKSLYYLRTTAKNEPDSVSQKLIRDPLPDGKTDCASCQG